MLSSARYQEAEIVRVTLVVLFLSLVIVYVTYFHINQDKYFQANENQQVLPGDDLTGTGVQRILDSSLSPDLSSIPSTFESSSDADNGDVIAEALSGRLGLDPTSEAEEPISTPINFAQSGDLMSTGVTDDLATNNSEEPDILESEEPTMIILSGTSQYFGAFDAADVMGLDYMYALSDWEVLYAYLGTGDYDFKPIARNLGGNVVEIIAEIDILKNDLFWEKINFVNIPGVTYTTIPVEERQKVFMIVRFGDDRRLIQVDFASYHRLKSIMKQRFASYY